MELKDFLKIFFEKPNEYSKLTSSEKTKFFFMLQRFMSISLPLQANAFNNIRISQAKTVDYWHTNMSKLYKKAPDWIYTKTNKVKHKNISMPSDEAVKFYLDKMNISKRDLNDAIKLFGEEALEPIRRIEKILSE